MSQDLNQNKERRDPYQKHGIVSVIFFICLIVFIISLIFFRNQSFGISLIWASGILTVLNFIIAMGYQEKCKGYCEGCGRKLTDKEVRYNKGKVITSENRACQRVRFMAVCSSCGKTKIFDTEFTISKIDLNGWEIQYDVDEQAKQYIDNRYN